MPERPVGADEALRDAVRRVTLAPELEAELVAIRRDVAAAGGVLWLDAACKLHLFRGARVPASVKDRIRAHTGRLVLELLVAECYRWRLEAWRPAELDEIRRGEPADLVERRVMHLHRAIAAVAAGDVEAGRAALDSLRTSWRATARAVLGEAGDRLPPDDFPNNPPKGAA